MSTDHVHSGVDSSVIKGGGNPTKLMAQSAARARSWGTRKPLSGKRGEGAGDGKIRIWVAGNDDFLLSYVKSSPQGKVVLAEESARTCDGERIHRDLYCRADPLRVSTNPDYCECGDGLLYGRS